MVEILTNQQKKDRIRSNEGLKKITKMAKEGKTLEQIAKSFGICVRTFYNWVRKYPEVADALYEGKNIADDLVEQSLYDACLAHDVTEVRIETDPDGNTVKRITTTKHIPANVTAIQYWLQNRRNDKWKDRRQVEFDGESAVPIRFVNDLPNPFEKKDKDDDGRIGPDKPE